MTVYQLSPADVGEVSRPYLSFLPFSEYRLWKLYPVLKAVLVEDNQLLTAVAPYAPEAGFDYSRSLVLSLKPDSEDPLRFGLGADIAGDILYLRSVPAQVSEYGFPLDMFPYCLSDLSGSP